MNLTAAARQQKKRILLCAHSVDMGGSAKSLAILAKELSRSYRVAIITLREPSPQAEEWYRKAAIPLFAFPFGWLPLSYVNCPINIDAQTKRSLAMRPYLPQLRWLGEGADFICFNGYPATSLAPHFPPKTPRTLIAREVPDKSTPGFGRAASFLRANISRAIAIGPVEAACLNELGIENAIVFNSAASPPNFEEFLPGRPIFGTFSRFGPDKGLDLLCEAALLAAPTLSGMGAKIKIFGANGPQRLGMEEKIAAFIAAHGLADVLEVHDWVEDAADAMSGIHCLVRPDASLSPWGRDIIEAMSIGRPALAMGSLELFVRSSQTGWLVSDVHEMAAALAGLAKNPSQLVAAGRAAYAFAEKNFNPQTNTRRIAGYLFAGEPASTLNSYPN